MTVPRPSSPTLLAGLLAGAGVLHFVLPAPYESIVPKRLGHARALVYASGAAELTVAAAVSRSSTRARGAQAAAALFLAVFPANVSMAFDPTRPPGLHRAALARLPLQVPLIVWALRVARDAQSR